MSINNQHKPRYKHSPVGWIPEEWQLASVANITNDHKQGFYTKEEYSLSGRYFLIRGMDLFNPKIRWQNSPKVEASLNDYELFKLEKDDFLFVRSGNIGSYGIVEEEMPKSIFASYLIKFKFDSSKVLNQFFGYFYSAPIALNQLKVITQGSTNININANNIKRLLVPLPPIKEQEEIISILSTWDEAITKTQQLIVQLQQRNKSLMQQLLTGKKRLKGFEGEKWNRLHIYDVAKEVSLKNRDDKQLTVLSCTKYDGLVPSLEYFGRRVFGSDTSTYKVVPLYHFAYATNHIEEGSIGYQNIFKEALISPMYTVFKTNDQVHDDYLFKLLKSHHYIHEYCRRMEGSIDRRGGLRWDEFSKIAINLPQLDEQIAIATLVNKAVGEVKLYEQKLAALQLQKKGLMQKLLTGEVRVNLSKQHIA